MFVPGSLNRVPSYLITTRDSKDNSMEELKTAVCSNTNVPNSLIEQEASNRPFTSYNITFDSRK